jgi:glycine cleavage system T protein
MQQSSLYPMHQALGASCTEVAGWSIPSNFGNVEEEYQAVRQAVGVMDLSHRSLVRMTGSHRQRFLQAMVSNNTADLEPGQGCYATFLTNKGKLVADFVVYADAEAYWFDLEPGLAPILVQALDFFIIADDVTLTDATTEWGLLSVQGPYADELLMLACGQELPSMPRLSHTTCRIGGQEVRLIARSHTGEAGYQLMAPMAALPALWEALWEHRDTCELRAVGLEALEILRIEAGVPVFGRDMTEETIPVEANLTEAISYTKGCYVGQEVIARLDARGHVNRRLMGLRLEGDTLPQVGDVIVSPEREVGWVTSTTFSPALQQPIAMGYIRREAYAPGTALTIQSASTTIAGEVVELPFYTATSKV